MRTLGAILSLCFFRSQVVGGVLLLISSLMVVLSLLAALMPGYSNLCCFCCFVVFCMFVSYIIMEALGSVTLLPARVLPCMRAACIQGNPQ